ncbi:MAG TPA: deoxyribose-phosphate aldolase [Terriglobales bacterium]|jgi:deoxyribose-phosphate aldolase|nr:deoxyribose-phosphate aldolase [Terriglobales bacterium]
MPTVSDWQAAAKLIDHTLLKPEATTDQVTQLCREALKFGFASVCVQPCYVPLTGSLLQGSAVKVCTVIGFPSGATLSECKRFEASEVLRLGARELDMVINIGALKSRDHAAVQADIQSVAEVTHQGGAILKVIIETALLTREEKIKACELAVAAGAEFVKTSTGFAGGGATVEDVALMRQAVGDRAKVKASGGIRSAADFQAMVSAGADRVGASASVAIMRELGAP